MQWLQQTLNRRIGESATALGLIAALEGRSFDVVVEGLELTFRLSVRDAGLQLERHGDDDAPADAAIHGTPLALLGLLNAAHGAAALAASQATLVGDTETARSFSRLADALRPELEEELAYWVGDMLAHQAARALTGLAGFGRRARHALEANAAEYLQEEIRVLPAPQEVEALFADTEQLRDDVERAAWRVDRLTELLTRERP